MRTKYREKISAWGYIVLYENTSDRFHKINHVRFGEHYEVDVCNSTQHYSTMLMYLREVNEGNNYTFTRIYKNRYLHEEIDEAQAQDRFPEYFI